MSETEIALAQAYLARSGQDPVAALIRSVRDVAAMRRLLGGRLTHDEAAWVSPQAEPAHLLPQGETVPRAVSAVG